MFEKPAPTCTIVFPFRTAEVSTLVHPEKLSAVVPSPSLDSKEMHENLVGMCKKFERMDQNCP